MNRIKKILSIFLIGIASLSCHAQSVAGTKPIYKYFLWYDGVVDDLPVLAKLSVGERGYALDLAFSDTSIRCVGRNIEEKIDSIVFDIYNPFEYKSHGKINLSIEDLWNVSGQWFSDEGIWYPITLKLRLNKLDDSVFQENSELIPLAVDLNRMTTAITVYESEEGTIDGKPRVILYKSDELDYGSATYVDVNFDRHLDIVINDQMFLFNMDSLKFISNLDGDSFFPGIDNYHSYNIGDSTFQCIHFRQILRYKSIHGAVGIYEREVYSEYYENPQKIDSSENRIRYIDGEEKYIVLELYTRNEKIDNVDEFMKHYLSKNNIEVIDGAELSLHMPSGKTNYLYSEGHWINRLKK